MLIRWFLANLFGPISDVLIRKFQSKCIVIANPTLALGLRAAAPAQSLT